MKKGILWGFAVIFGLINLWNSAPLQAQLFQNNDTSCEDFSVVGMFFLESPSPSTSITCGRFNDDSPAGNPDFPDCATIRDPLLPFSSPTPTPLPSYSILTNTAQHNPNNCFNAGGTSQFSVEDLTNVDLVPPSPNIVPEPIFLGSIVSGNLDGGDFEDLVHPVSLFDQRVTPDNTRRMLEQLFSLPGGGFGGPNVSTTGVFLEPDPTPDSPLVPVPTFWRLIFNPILLQLESLIGDRSLALTDCNGNGLDDALVATVRQEGSDCIPSVMVLRNQLGELIEGLPNTDNHDLPVSCVDDEPVGMALTVNDFNNDEIPDVAVVVNTTATPGIPPPVIADYVAICFGQNACGFDCPTDIGDPRVQIIDFPFCASNNCFEYSIDSGDYNGDTRPDLVVSLFGGDPSNSGVFYLFNDGGNLQSWQREFKDFNPVSSIDPVLTIATGRFSTTAVQNGVDEIAVTYSQNFSSVIDALPTVQVLTTDGQNGINAPVPLIFTPSDDFFAAGIDAADFDHCGGDDLMAISTLVDQSDPMNIQILSGTSLFLNNNEPPVVTIDPDNPTQVFLDESLDIATTCMDPTFDDRTFQWSVLSRPPGSNVALSNGDGSLTGNEEDVSTAFTADSLGDYTLQISCTDFCGLSDEETITVTVVPLLTQGANLFNCSLTDPFAPEPPAGPLLILFVGPLVFWLRKRGLPGAKRSG